MVFLFITRFSVAWQDHPDVQDFKETDRIYKAACEQVGYDEYDLLLQKQEREYDKEYRHPDVSSVQ
jgi:hypothetical protein